MGLSAGIAAVTTSFILLLALTNGQFLVSALAAALLGACLGFLRYNFPPARIFMGDVGSLFLGFLLAVMGIQLRFPENSNFVTWMVPVFLLGLPIFDMTLVVVSRLRRGLSPNTAGRDHTSHRLVRLGFSSREAVLILYLFSGILGMMAPLHHPGQPGRGLPGGGASPPSWPWSLWSGWSVSGRRAKEYEYKRARIHAPRRAPIRAWPCRRRPIAARRIGGGRYCWLPASAASPRRTIPLTMRAGRHNCRCRQRERTSFYPAHSRATSNLR
jgi:hypothetical protein